MVDVMTEQGTRLKVADGRGDGRDTRWGVRPLSGLFNLLIPIGLLLVLLLQSAALSSFEVLALVGLISLAVVVSLARGVDRPPMRLANSVNDNRPGEVLLGSELADALRRCRHAFCGVALVSGLINILMLTGPLFMLQVYDRVLPSHSVPTLIGLALLTVGLFSFQGILDACRGRDSAAHRWCVNHEISRAGL